LSDIGSPTLAVSAMAWTGGPAEAGLSSDGTIAEGKLGY